MLQLESKLQVNNKKRIFESVYLNYSWWSNVPMALPDPILGLTEIFNRDSNPNKVNLGVGVYRDDNGKPQVFSCVRKAENIIREKKLDKEYLPIMGHQEFCKKSIELALGADAGILRDNLNATAQSISGTGALSMGGIFLKKFFPGNKVIYQPSPTWANHKNIFTHTGLDIKNYKYYDLETNSFDFKGALDDIKNMPQKSIILFHATAHNPTGMDPNKEQWSELSALVKEKQLFPFFDMSYQGFATGDNDNDAYSVRKFIKDGNQIMLAQSFSKNMGLYGERIGAFTITCSSKEEVALVESQIKLIITALFYTPPSNGARIAAEVLSNKSLGELWVIELQRMVNRIVGCRKKLREHLKKEGSVRNWDHITKQTGMFSYTGLTSDQVEKLTKNYSIYLNKDGRISMAAVTSKNVEYIAHAIHEVTK